MVLLHGWAVAAGAAAASLPVLVHWLNRARGKRLPFPTVRFVLEAEAARRRIRRLRDAAVLVLRLLAILALAGAFARFLRRDDAALPPGAPGGRWAVVVLDLSESMAAKGAGASPIERARGEARRILSDAGLARADLVLAAARPRAVFGRLSANLAALREEAGKAAVRPEALDPSAAIREAAAVLANLPEPERRGGAVWVLTDLQRTNWAQASFADLPADAPVRILDVRGAKAPFPNAGVLRASAPAAAVAGRRSALAAAVALYGQAPAARTLQVAFDGGVERRTVSLPPRQVRQEAFELRPSAPGPRTGVVRLGGEPDALSEDDARPFALFVRPGRRVVLAGADPPGRTGTPAYFLERGLLASDEAGFEVARVAPAGIAADGAPMEGAALLVLSSPGRLPRPALERLATRLAAGLPVLYALDDGADADNLAELVSILGPAARLPSAFAPLPPGSPARFLVWADPARRPFRLLGEGVGRIARDLPLEGGLRGEPRGDDPEGQIRARLSDGSAALVVSPVASGRLALWNLPLRGATHLGKSPLLVPLVQELALDLAEGSEGRAREGTCGRPFSLRIRAAPAPKGVSWRVVDEAGKEVPGPRVSDDGGGPFLVWNPADRLGAFAVLRAGEAVEAFAIGLPPEESDLEPLDPRVLEERIARGRPILAGPADALGPRSARERETWPAFAGAALALLLFELAALKGFGG